MKYKYKCRHCWKTFIRDYLIKRSFCEKFNKDTNLILIKTYEKKSTNN